MMRLTAKAWIGFSIVALLCGALWCRFGYPRFSFIYLQVTRSEALERARDYLRSRDEDPARFSSAVQFKADGWADRYLQQTLPGKRAQEFIEKHDYEIFRWRVRFFREMEKEEYQLEVSPRTGEVISFYHFIDDIAVREEVSEEDAQRLAVGFLSRTFGIDLSGYDLHEKKIKRRENRVDHIFLWERRDVYVPWKDNQGGAKLLTGVLISGNEVREFYKHRLDIPEKFERYIENQFVFGDTLYSVYFLVFLALVGTAVVVLIKRRGAHAVRTARRFYFLLAIFLLVINLGYVANNLQEILFSYPTSSRLSSFFAMYLVRLLTDAVFLAVIFIIPGLSGESLRREVFPRQQQASFLSSIQSSFFTRKAAASVLFGYLLFVILLGMQSVIFYFGQQYLGVWKEWIKMAQFSSACIPALSAFAVAVSASLSEEIVFRLFGISLLKKYTRNTFCAVFLMALLWGVGHSGYAIFPVWFRGLEVGLAGIFFGIIFVRYGLIPLLVAHYLFDAFWGIAPHLIGHTTIPLFSQAALLFLLPLFFAAAAFMKNAGCSPRETALSLSRIQRYNLGVLEVYVRQRISQGVSVEALKEELLKHNWDVELIDIALQQGSRE
ncbi:MAG: CPBP family intramembrane metalloprotease [Candidatus Omnitrophica bacterium]|nr:CPBP family intramembrane metalloprotease [Candidatus Omnitrophota bacterium]